MPKATPDTPAVYKKLQLVNKRLIQAADAIEQLRMSLEAPGKQLLYSRRLIQETRATICEWVLESLHPLEMAEVFRLSKQREAEDKKLRDPDDVYIDVRRREKERKRQGLPAKIRFADE